ncbi:MAG: hypothetical protein JNL97_16725, partial [Verrucomicrobiales bacterium]|nr:hypothetical protein [Verrucomicrobiales bacterium]
MKPRTWRAALWAAYGVSGAPGLIAQVAWMRMLSAGLGHEFSALTGVLAAFFGGMALGAWLARRPRRTMIEAARLYGMLELACGCWILATVPSVSAGCERVMGWVGPEASPWILGAVGFACAFGIIGPAATAMGATLPAMERAMRPLESDGRAVSALYAWNTAGAWIGIGLAIGWLMPTHGFRATLAIAGALQVVCGACVWFVARRDPGADGCLEDRPGEDRRGASGGEGVGAWRRVVWASGFLGIGFELLGVRAVAQTTENTIRTYGWVVASVLMGTVLGAVVARRFAGSGRWAAAPAGFGALACMCGVSVVGLTWSG